MTRQEFLSFILANLPTQLSLTRLGDNSYSAKFDHVETLHDGMLRTPTGRGDTTAAAESDLLAQCLGQHLVYGAYKDTRKELRLPAIKLAD